MCRENIGKCSHFHYIKVYFNYLLRVYVVFTVHPPHTVRKGSRAWTSIHQADGRLTAKSREVSKPRYSGLDFSNRSEI